jgi:hypothetical protein
MSLLCREPIFNGHREVKYRYYAAHNAVTDWTDAFGGEGFANRRTSEELAPALARSDGRPVLVFGSVVDVIAQNDGCKPEVDAKANLVSNIRFWLSCTPAQVKEAMSHREEAHVDALEEIREDAVDQGEEETIQEKQDDERQAKRMARQGYAVIARGDTVHSSEEAETNDDPPAKAQFTFAEGHCLELLYVGRGYSLQGGDEGYLRTNSSEDERRARLEMEVRTQLRIATQKLYKKGNQEISDGGKPKWDVNSSENVLYPTKAPSSRLTRRNWRSSISSNPAASLLAVLMLKSLWKAAKLATRVTKSAIRLFQSFGTTTLRSIPAST